MRRDNETITNRDKLPMSWSPVSQADVAYGHDPGDGMRAAQAGSLLILLPDGEQGHA
jgi:hypothetical protein